MKAAVLSKLRKWEYKDIPMPKINDKTKFAIIKIKLNGICSTDVLRSMETGFYNYPIVPGHEMIGEVHEIKKNPSLKIGDRVAVYPLIPCEACEYCKSKNPNLCDNYSFLGSRTNGGYAQYVYAPINNLIKIPNNVSDEKAIFTEPLSVALHAHRVAEDFLKPKKILILGLGPIGLLIALWAKYKKIKHVVAIDRNKNRFKIFNKIGYNKTIDSSKKSFMKDVKLSGKFDTVFETSGSTELQKLGITMTAKKGQFILLSNPNDDLIMDKSCYSLILRGEINFRGSWSSLINPINEWKLSLKMLSQSKLDPSALITKVVDLSDLPSTMPLMYEKKFSFIKVAVK